MRFPLSWLEDACGFRPDAATLLAWLREAGADARSGGADAIEVDLDSGPAHLASVDGLATELRSRAGLPPRPAPRLPAGPVLRIEIADGLSARVAAVALTAPGGIRLPAPHIRRLVDAGIEVTGTIVDLLRYVEVETGQPVAVVDARLVSAGALRLRPATPSEVAAAGRTPHGAPRLPAGSPLLASGDRPLALPCRREQPAPVPLHGREVLLFAWWLAPRTMRTAGAAYGPEAADGDITTRLTRGLHPAACDLSVARAAELATRGAPGAVTAVGAGGRAEPVPRTWLVHTDELRHAVDPSLSAGRIADLLRTVGVRVDAGPNGALRLTAPPSRPDLDRVAMVAAEIARVHGHHAVPARMPPPVRPPAPAVDRALRRTVRDAAVRAGLYEVITPVLTQAPRAAASPAREAGAAAPAIEFRGRAGMRNLLLRDSLLPGVLKVAARSLRHTGAAHHFEIGAVPVSARPGAERWRFTAVLGGPLAPSSLNDPAPRSAAFADLLALLHVLRSAIERGEPELAPARHPAFDASASFAVRLGGREVGWAGRIAAKPAEFSEATGAVLFGTDLDLGVLRELPLSRRVVRLPEQLPLPAFNVTVVAPEETSAADVLGLVAEAGGTTQRLVRVKDLGQGERIGSGLLSLTVRAEFRWDGGGGLRAERRRRREMVLSAVRARGWEGS